MALVARKPMECAWRWGPPVAVVPRPRRERGESDESWRRRGIDAIAEERWTLAKMGEGPQ